MKFSQQDLPSPYASFLSDVSLRNLLYSCFGGSEWHLNYCTEGGLGEYMRLGKNPIYEVDETEIYYWPTGLNHNQLNHRYCLID